VTEGKSFVPRDVMRQYINCAPSVPEAVIEALNHRQDYDPASASVDFPVEN
jgi:hypothetical protein